jgi:Pyruvate/2-oxoacid:ferredoxin oxidoreductase delta subunit
MDRTQVCVYKTKFITKFFKNYSLKISFKTKNNKGKWLNSNENINKDKFSKCGTYELTCPDCNTKQSDRLVDLSM